MPRPRLPLYATVCASLLAGSASGQIPETFTNLEVLPDSLDRQQVVDVMRGWASALGVRCRHCHVGDRDDSLEGFDFASDDKEPKRTARVMYSLTERINRDLKESLAASETEVRCVTCHRGLTDPRTIDEILLASIDEKGIDAGLAHYRSLREELLGQGNYDFGAAALNGVAEVLASGEQVLEAIAVMELNVELHASLAYPHYLLATLRASTGDREGALRAAFTAAEMEPENGWYSRYLEKLAQED